MEWIQNANAVVALIGALVGLVPGIIAAVVAVVKLFKDKKANEVWKTIMAIADAAMREAEKSSKSGAEKKEIAMNAIKAACLSQGIDVSNLVDQIAAYVDNCIVFYNNMTDATKEANKN